MLGAVLVIKDLPHALAGQADLANDVNLLPALVGSLPDRGKEAGVTGTLALLGLSVRPREHAQVRCVDHAMTISYANHLDKRTPHMPRWLA